MKKNSEYVGVDEKFIPENEKYVNDSILGSKEESKKKMKKALKIGLGVWAIWVIVGIAFFVIVVMLIFNHSKNMNKQVFDIFNSATEQIKDGMQEQNDPSKSINQMQQITDAMMGSMSGQSSINNDINKQSFNATLEMYSGTEYGSSVGSLLDKVVTSNKTNKDHIITVIYKETTTTSENEIVKIKHSLDKFTEYEVSLDYDANGYINKVTVKDIK